MNSPSPPNDQCGYPPGLATSLPPGLPPSFCLTPTQIAILTTLPPPAISVSTVVTILLYIYAAGVVMNGSILFACCWNHKSLLKTLLDRLTFGLVGVCFVWSFGRALFHGLEGLNVLTLQNAGAAAFSNIMILSIFCLNVQLAMERCFQIENHPCESRLYAGLYSVTTICIGAVVWMFIDTTTYDGVKPDSDPQRTTWVVVATFCYGMTIILIVWFYTRTYLFFSRQFDGNPALATFFMSERDSKNKDDPETLGLVRHRVGRQILARCLMLSLSLVICYLPFYSYQIMSYAYGILPLFDPTGIFYSITVILLSADVLITPLLVFLFRKEVREAFMFWK
ncbi:hypothetical protein HDU98_005775 [Podochytrium sp. JEL0797]|nr:hypothetical protein HDU98_005775 [Podochytrium sp. JEL0797]